MSVFLGANLMITGGTGAFGNAVLKYSLTSDIPASYPVFFHLFQTFAVIGIAYSFPKLEIKTDISYGLYLYHMIVVNIMVHFGLIWKTTYLFVALVCRCLLAYLSTAMLERLARQRKSVLIA